MPLKQLDTLSSTPLSYLTTSKFLKYKVVTNSLVQDPFRIIIRLTILKSVSTS